MLATSLVGSGLVPDQGGDELRHYEFASTAPRNDEVVCFVMIRR